ncbi:hypothetical protein CFC21_094767, partial [Triticum aestivum]
GVVVGVGVG